MENECRLTKTEAQIVNEAAQRQSRLQEQLAAVQAHLGQLARLIQAHRGLPAGRPTFTMRDGDLVLRVQPEEPDA